VSKPDPAINIEHHECDLTVNIEHHECDLTISIEHHECDLTVNIEHHECDLTVNIEHHRRVPTTTKFYSCVPTTTVSTAITASTQQVGFC
jgi:hypothetical protein